MLVGGSPGCADGVNGDQLQLSPPLVMTEAQIDDAVGMLAAAIETAGDGGTGGDSDSLAVNGLQYLSRFVFQVLAPVVRVSWVVNTNHSS